MLAVVSSRDSLGFEAAAVLARTAAERSLAWIRTGHAPHEASRPDGLDWLFPRAPEPLDAALGDATIAGLLAECRAAELVYGCSCSEERLVALARRDLGERHAPRYDGVCRMEPTGAAVRQRLAVGPASVQDRPIGPVLRLLAVCRRDRPERLLVEPAAERAVEIARALLGALGEPVPEVGVGPCFIGPDGAPLWRAAETATIPALVRQGFEPDAVLEFLRRPVRGRVLIDDREALTASNQRALRAMSAPERARRLGVLFQDAGMGACCGRIGEIWDAIQPRIRVLAEAPRLVGFLHPDWKRPGPIPARDASTLRAAWRVLRVGGVGTEEHLEKLLEEFAGDRWDRVLDLRRVIRWSLTGQTIAPPLSTVWKLLGHVSALDRLEEAAASCAADSPASGSEQG